MGELAATAQKRWQTTLVVTMGPEGVLVLDGSQADRTVVGAHPVEVVDTVGAGDVFCGYLGAQLAQGAVLVEAVAAANAAAANKEFRGFPIPAAAGVIASVTLFLLWFDERGRDIGQGKWVLPPLMLFLAWMMFSGFKYPSFKAIDWRTTLWRILRSPRVRSDSR